MRYNNSVKTWLAVSYSLFLIFIIFCGQCFSQNVPSALDVVTATDGSTWERVNIPGFGRTKEIAPESKFEFFVLSKKPLKLAKWIRLGKWMSKAELTTEEMGSGDNRKNGDFIFPYLLNPLDVMFSHQVLSYDVVNMPPVSLIQNIKIRGQHYQFENLTIPACMEYRFRAN